MNITNDFYVMNYVHINKSKYTENYTISNEEFVEWSIELLTPQELHDVIMMIRYAKNRSTSVRPFLETIAVGIVNKQ